MDLNPLDAVSSIVHDIAHGVSDIVHTVSSIIEDIGKTILNSIKHIIHVISDNIGYVAIAAMLGAVAVTIFAPEVWPVIGESISSMIGTGIADAETAFSAFQSYWSGLTAWWSNSIGPYIVDGLKTIATINEVALIVNDFKKGHYLQGLTRLFQDTLPKLSKEFDAKIQGIITNVTHTFNTLQGDISDVATTADEVNTGLGQVQTDLSNIGSAFGVKEISHVAEGIGRFRKDVLDRISNEAEITRTELSNIFFTAMSPLIQWDQMYQSIIYDKETAARRMAGLTAIGLQGLNVVPSMPTYLLAFTGGEFNQVREWLAQIRQTLLEQSSRLLS